MLALITNRSFIDSRAYDGFRKCIQNDFNECYIVDTKSDVRLNPKIAGTTHNVFGIQTGVAIMLLVKKEMQEGECKIKYVSMEDDWRKEIKLDWLRNHKLGNISFENINPDKKNNWINLSDNDFEELIPTIDKDVKSGNSKNSLFQLFSSGIKSQRDEWVYDNSKDALENKVKFMIDVYSKTLSDEKYEEKNSIKWDSDLNKYLDRGIDKNFSENKILKALYRPFTHQYFYFDKHFNGRTYQWFEIFNSTDFNEYIIIPGLSSPKDFFLLSSSLIIDLNCLPAGCQCIPLYRYSKKGERIENITNWGLEQFRTNYKDKKITKEEIFHYTYAVLHNPAYRKKYELNLKRDFPRIPFYKDFWQWSKWGKKLMELHINYETVKPYSLKENTFKTKAEAAKQKKLFPVIKEPQSLYALQPKIKVKLKADKDNGIIELDELTYLSGVPAEAWEYKLGNRSALEWILDQYKEKKPSDPTIAEKFNTYRFADYKTQVIDLLKRVCTVSVETMKIIKEMDS